MVSRPGGKSLSVNDPVPLAFTDGLNGGTLGATVDSQQSPDGHRVGVLYDNRH